MVLQTVQGSPAQTDVGAGDPSESARWNLSVPADTPGALAVRFDS